MGLHGAEAEMVPFVLARGCKIVNILGFRHTERCWKETLLMLDTIRLREKKRKHDESKNKNKKITRGCMLSESETTDYISSVPSLLTSQTSWHNLTFCTVFESPQKCGLVTAWNTCVCVR
jgi:hypothetical protein